MNVSWRALPWTKFALALVVIASGAVLLVCFRDRLSLAALSQQESTLRDWQREQPLLTYAIAFAVYVLVTGLSLPGAAVLSLVYGWLFGFLPGLILVSFASTTGATIACALSRYLFGGFVQRRFGERLVQFNERLDREGALYLFTLRLIPAVPFFVINVVMGLTRLPLRTFWWVSQLGMLPGTCVYLWAGSSVPTLRELSERGTRGLLSPQMIVAFIALGLFPLVIRRMFRNRTSP